MEGRNNIITPEQPRGMQPDHWLAHPSEQPTPVVSGKRRARFRLKTKYALVVLAMVVFASGGAIIWKGTGDKPITAFSIGSNTTKPANGEFINQATLAQGDTLRLQIRYQPEQVKSLRLQIMGADGSEVFKSGDFQLNEQSEFSLAMSTAALEPGSYKVVVIDQDQKQLQHSDLVVDKGKNQDEQKQT